MGADRESDDGRGRTVLIVGASDAAGLTAGVRTSGWEAETAPLTLEACTHWHASAAGVLLVDARSDCVRALTLVRALASSVEERGAALVVLAACAADAAAAFDLGATHFLLAPADNEAVDAVLCFAGRYVDRLRQAAGGAMGKRAPRDAGRAKSLDSVTGLPDGRYAKTWLGERLAAGDACAVVLVAVSRFDAVNASHGPSVGDAALQAVGRRLRRSAERFAPPERLLVARLGGAEFAAAFAGAVEPDALARFAASVAQAFARPFVAGGRLLHLSCRMGGAVGHGDGAEALLQRASGALALARRGEPNGFRIATGDDMALLPGKGLDSDLNRALEASGTGIEVVYQPQVEIISNRIVGVEALVRWRHPTLGTLSADTVVETAERAELTARLGRRVMRTALEEATAWNGASAALRLSVNVTAQDMRAGDFEAELLHELQRTCFPPERLTLEITESGLIEDIGHAADMLARLRGHGIKVAIDDFGTGYSSLAYLKSLPLDTLKVDRGFVADLAGGARDRVIVRGVVDMARSLGMGVVAEGVETADQLDLVVREGCTWYQGFLCSPPVPSAALGPLVAAWQGAA